MLPMESMLRHNGERVEVRRGLRAWRRQWAEGVGEFALCLCFWSFVVASAGTERPYHVLLRRPRRGNSLVAQLDWLGNYFNSANNTGQSPLAHWSLTP